MTDDPLVRLVDDARLEEAVAERAARRVLRDADADDATLAGTLADLAEQRALLVLDTTAGHRVRGRVVGVAGDHVVVSGDHGTAWVALVEVAAVRARPGNRLDAGGGDRAGAEVRPLHEALRDLVQEGAEVHVLVAGADPLRGRLHAVGRDLMTLRHDDPGDRTLVPLARVAVVSTRTVRTTARAPR